jgi:undecaprenyl diphosphate synthase
MEIKHETSTIRCCRTKNTIDLFFSWYIACRLNRMRLLEVVSVPSFPSIPARTSKRRSCLIVRVFRVVFLLPIVVSLQSIIAPCKRGRFSEMKQWNGVRHPMTDAALFALSLRNELDYEEASDVVEVVSQNNIGANHHAMSVGFPSSATFPDPPVPSVARNLPRHIAFVCDGNTRWASARNLPASMGHAAGANRTYELIRYFQSYASSGNPSGSSITHVTFYAFSTENWNRPSAEIREIFTVIERTARLWFSTLRKDSGDDSAVTEKSHIIFKTIGDLYDGRIPKSLRESLLQLEDRTQEIAARITAKYWDDHNQSNTVDESPPSFLTICVAINYGGRQDIVSASKRLIRKMLGEKQKFSTKEDFVPTITEDDVEGLFNEASLATCLDTASLPDPDLLVRTSGESRLSNFLLWNVAYTELYFSDTLWPDFDGAAIGKALRWYSQRERRFGRH